MAVPFSHSEKELCLSYLFDDFPPSKLFVDGLELRKLFAKMEGKGFG